MEIELINEELFTMGSGLDRTKAQDTGKIHLSDIAKYIEYKMKFGPSFTKGGTQWNLLLAAEVGFLWEDVLSKCLGDRYAARPGEIELDGIVGSPDGLGLGDAYGVSGLVDEEYKATWRSVKKTPETIWYWMTQFKSYCTMMDVDVTIARVLYIMGDYKGSGPMYQVYKIQFTYAELTENWDMILRHRDEMVERGYMDLSEALKGEEF